MNMGICCNPSPEPLEIRAIREGAPIPGLEDRSGGSPAARADHASMRAPFEPSTFHVQLGTSDVPDGRSLHARCFAARGAAHRRWSLLLRGRETARRGERIRDEPSDRSRYPSGPPGADRTRVRDPRPRRDSPEVQRPRAGDPRLACEPRSGGAPRRGPRLRLPPSLAGAVPRMPWGISGPSSGPSRPLLHGGSRARVDSHGRPTGRDADEGTADRPGGGGEAAPSPRSSGGDPAAHRPDRGASQTARSFVREKAKVAEANSGVGRDCRPEILGPARPDLEGSV
jgi:hypothetical protein